MNNKSINVDNKYIGSISSHNNKSYAVDSINNVPDITMKDIHVNNKYIGVASSHNEKPYVFDSINNIPSINNRNTYSKQSRINIIGTSQIAKPTQREDAHNMIIDDTKEHIIKSRRPTNSNVSMGPISEFTEFNFNEPVFSNREPVPTINNSSLDRLNSAVVQPVDLPNTDWYNDSYVDLSLQGNPYINNVVHVSSQ